MEISSKLKKKRRHLFQSLKEKISMKKKVQNDKKTVEFNEKHLSLNENTDTRILKPSLLNKSNSLLRGQLKNNKGLIDLRFSNLKLRTKLVLMAVAVSLIPIAF